MTSEQKAKFLELKGSQKILARTLFNRELSWLAFNERVLDEARDSSHPLLERLKFVSIVSSNLDEFFMIRVAGLERKARKNPEFKLDDGLTVEECLYQVREWTLAQKTRQAQVFLSVLELLKPEGILIQSGVASNDPLIEHYKSNLAPKVKPFEGKAAEVFATLQASKIYVFVRTKNRFGIIPLPTDVPRLYPVPREIAQAGNHFVFLEHLVAASASVHFGGEAIVEAFPFKVIRDADVKVDPETDPEDLLHSIEAALQAKERKNVVRLEIEAPAISDGALFLANALKLHSRALYRYDSPLDLKVLWFLHGLHGFDHLRDKPLVIQKPGVINSVPELVEMIRKRDFILHHPYDSFDAVVDLLKAASADEAVTEIKQTLYRTNETSLVVEALREASKNKKKVKVLVELKARFDEANNVRLAKNLQKAGAQVIQGFSNLKIHCKVTQIIRKDAAGKEFSFVHVGTGNYNPSTARIYTDLGLITTDEAMGRDAAKLFQALETGRMPRKFEKFVVAPLELHEKLLLWIKNEAQRARKGDREARIIVKVNALVDPKIITALYAASQAGVKIDLIVRGVCSLRPGVPGLSENVRVISIVDRFLEHSRIYYFHNGGDEKVYLSSADWMPRNFFTRIEVAFPVEDPQIKTHIRHVILETQLNDNVKARELQPDGQWIKRSPQPGETPLRSQEFFIQLAERGYEGTPLWNRFR